jgi:hypothetical protein
MKKLLLPAFLFGMICLVWTDANSCGDKFLVIGRGLRYERAYAAVHPAAILVYTNDAKLNSELESILKKSGEKITIVPDEAALFANLQSTKYDLVLLNMSSVAALESRVMSTTYKPSVLPVIYNKTGTELNAAEKQYDCVLKYSGKNKDTVAVIDEVMDAKLKGKPQVCKWSKS